MPKVKKTLEIPRSNDGVSLTSLPCIQTMQFVSDDLPVCTDAMLQDMFSNNEDEASPSPQTPLEKQCPVCQINLHRDEVDRGDGSGAWSYYRCPNVTDYTKCYILPDACDGYTASRVQTRSTELQCRQSEKSLILAMSNSDKNKYRLYFKSPKRECNFFQWADTDAVGKVRRWLHQGVNPDAKGKEQRHKPYDLQKPIPRAPQKRSGVPAD